MTPRPTIGPTASAHSASARVLEHAGSVPDRFRDAGGCARGVRLSLYQEFENQLREDMGEVLLTIRQIWPDEADLRAELERKAVTHKKRVGGRAFTPPTARSSGPAPTLRTRCCRSTRSRCRWTRLCRTTRTG